MKSLGAPFKLNYPTFLCEACPGARGLMGVARRDVARRQCVFRKVSAAVLCEGEGNSGVDVLKSIPLKSHESLHLWAHVHIIHLN
jgi:hypothetical protein